MDTAEGEEDKPQVPILAVGGQQSPPLTVSIELNGVPVTMQVDTGATVSLMSVDRSSDSCFPQALLDKPTVRFNTYTTESIAVVGQMTVWVSTSATLGGILCMYSSREWPHTPRLRMAAACTPRLKEPGVVYVHDWPVALTRTMEQHAEVFRDELGLVDKFKAELVAKPGA